MRRTGVFLAVVLACMTLAACSPVLAAPASTGHDPSHCTYRDNGQLPDPRCTPGSVNPAVTQANIHSTICTKNWTRYHARQPEAVTGRYKYDVAYPAYGVPQEQRMVLDDLIPLEVGGKSTPANWWPQQRHASYAKDRVENALNHAVCSGRVSLAAAQAAIASDWLTAEKRLGL